MTARMPNEGEQLSLAALMSRLDGVEIPIIQRDYAQGRAEAADIRATFLASLMKALQRGTAHALDLDFVYGSLNRKGPAVLSVLDGQQRLTTLFLLHWYLAMRDGQLGHFQTLFTASNRSKFRYATRASSTEFLNALAVAPLTASDIAAQPAGLSATLTDAHWFFSAWRKDPTVHACLTMLDALHEMFRNEDGLYLRLVSEDEPPITFHFLELTNFGLSDDLYIKMNARGKPLTAFENFKAWLVTRTTTEGAGVDFDSHIDMRWMDFFWRLGRALPVRPTTAAPQDVLFLRFLYLMAFFEACERIDGSLWLPANRARITWISRLRSARDYVSLHEFEDQKAYSRDTLRFTAELLDYFCGSPEAEDLSLLQHCLSGSERHDDLVKLYAVLCVLRSSRGLEDGDALKRTRARWSRVTGNLINNSRIDDLGNVPGAVQGLNSLSEHMLDLYGALSRETKISGLSQDQLKEEFDKAKLISMDASWEPLLQQAERHSYLQGRVGFLITFSCDENHSPNAERFARYAQKTAVLLDHDMLHSKEFLLQRALLSLSDYPVSKGGGRFSFCAPLRDSVRERNENWLLVVVKPVFQELLDRVGDDVQASLRELIRAASESCSDWRKYLLLHPLLIDYCGPTYLVQIDDDAHQTIFLMSKSRMSGYYSELRTRALYLSLKQMEQRNTLPSSFKSVTYEEVYGGLTPSLRINDGRQLKVTFDGEWSCEHNDVRCDMPEELDRLIRQDFVA